MPLFTPSFDNLIPEYGPIATQVFGAIWRFSQMTDHVCKASIQTISARVGYHRTTVIRAINTLIEAGLVKDLTPNLRHRPHILRPTENALQLIEALPEKQEQVDLPAGSGVAESDTPLEILPSIVAESDTDPVVIPPGIAESDTDCSSVRYPGIAGSDINQTLLRDLIRDTNISKDLKDLYQEKVEYINGQQFAFYRNIMIKYCRFHSFDGKVFKISHPDANYVRNLNSRFRLIYHRTLSLFIDLPDFQVEFVSRECIRTG